MQNLSIAHTMSTQESSGHILSTKTTRVFSLMFHSKKSLNRFSPDVRTNRSGGLISLVHMRDIKSLLSPLVFIFSVLLKIIFRVFKKF